MERGLILLVAALMVFMAPDVHGTAHLSFANDTQVNVTRAGCGVTKMCVETPDDCDPAGNDTCLFASLVASTPAAPDGVNLSIGLRGYSLGYVALGLASNASEGTTMLFICAQNNGTFIFRTVQRNNTSTMLSPTETRVTEIRGLVKDNVIRCEFDVPNMNATTFSILLGTGSFEENTPGTLNVSLSSVPLNLTDPSSNVATTATPTTTTSGASGVLRPHALLLLLSVLTLSVKQRA